MPKPPFARLRQTNRLFGTTMNNLTPMKVSYKIGLAFAVLLGLAACGQKGPLIVEPSDPLPTEALQEEPAQVETNKKD